MTNAIKPPKYSRMHQPPEGKDCVDSLLYPPCHPNYGCVIPDRPYETLPTIGDQLLRQHESCELMAQFDDDTPIVMMDGCAGEVTLKLVAADSVEGELLNSITFCDGTTGKKFKMWVRKKEESKDHD